MDPSFTDVEKRFVLAEIIKTSQLDINILANFVHVQGIEPYWMQMQLPLGRNMNQCVQAAEHMGIRSASQKRRASDDLSNHAKRVACLPVHFEPSATPAVIPAVPQPHKPILPRPSHDVQPQPQPQAQVQAPGPRKRGRPPRSERAPLRPMLPQIAPRPAEQNSDPGASQPSLPSLPLFTNSNSTGPRGSRYSTSPGPIEHQKKGCKGQQQHADTTESLSRPTHILDGSVPRVSSPRVLLDGTTDHPASSQPATTPNPTPMEPSLRSGAPALKLPPGLNPSFSHVLDRGGQIGRGSSSHNETQAPLASSA